MPTRVQVEGRGVVEFPDGMSEQDMRSALEQLAPSAEPKPASWVEKATSWLPTAGGIAGGIVGGIGGTVGGVGVGGVPGAIGGAAMGGATGEAARQLINRAAGAKAPASAGEAATGIVLQGAGQGAAQATGEGLAAATGPVAKWLMNRATTRVTQKLLQDFPDLSDTLIGHALEVSKGGLAKAQQLLFAAKAPARAAITKATADGITLPVQMTADVAESLKAALTQDAIRSRALTGPSNGVAASAATDQLPPPLKTLFASIDKAADMGGTVELTPAQADLFKTQLQRESRKVYLNPTQPNGPQSLDTAMALKADYARQLNQALGQEAPGYTESNAATQPLIGAVRGLKQAIRPNGNLYQAMVRPAVGAALGSAAGAEGGGGKWGSVAGGVAGAALTSPAGLSREAIVLASPQMQRILRMAPAPVANAIANFVEQHLGSLWQSGPESTTSQPASR